MIENIKVTFANKESVHTLIAGVNAMFMLSSEQFDYIEYYNLKRLQQKVLERMVRFNSSTQKIIIPMELNIYNTFKRLCELNSWYLNEKENDYLRVIILDIIEQGTQTLMRKLDLYNSQNDGL